MWLACDRGADARAVVVVHVQAVLAQHRQHFEREGDAERLEDVADLGLADLERRLVVEVDLVDRATGGDDGEVLHRSDPVAVRATAAPRGRHCRRAPRQRPCPGTHAACVARARDRRAVTERRTRSKLHRTSTCRRRRSRWPPRPWLRPVRNRRRIRPPRRVPRTGARSWRARLRSRCSSLRALRRRARCCGRCRR